MAKSDYLENAILDHIGGNTAFPQPTPFLALCSTATNDAGGGTELSGNGYARQSISFADAASGSMANDAAVAFTASGGDWDEATHFKVMDAVSAGNVLYHGALGTARTVTDGGTLQFDPGDIVLSED